MRIYTLFVCSSIGTISYRSILLVTEDIVALEVTIGTIKKILKKNEWLEYELWQNNHRIGLPERVV